MENKTIVRRDLSGVFLMDKLEGETKRHPTCFEECTYEKQMDFMRSLSREGLVDLCLQLSRTLKDIGNEFDIIKEG